jgi:uncharacterized iron-regulated membrane protein
MNPRKLLRGFHFITGVAAAIVLILLGVSGGLLVFEDEINHSLNSGLYRIHPQSPRLELNALVQKVESANPGTRVSNISFPEKDDIACSVQLKLPQNKGLGITVNPYTGEFVGRLDKANQFTNKLHQFHKNLLFTKRENGSLIMAWGAILLIGLAITGIILWWPRKIFGFGGAKSTGRLSFDLHNSLGFYASIFMLIFGVTGIIIHWDAEALQLAGRFSGQPPTLPIPKPSPAAPGAKPITAQAAFDAASAAVPGARIITMQNLGSTNAPLRITMRYPEDRTPAGRTNVYLHPTTGEVLVAQTSRDAPAPYRYVKLWNRQFHTGDVAGWPSRIIAALASFSLPLLAVTGPIMWISRHLRKRKAVP